MSKLVRLLLLVVTVSFFVTHAAAKGKPGGGGGKGGRETTDECEMKGDVRSEGSVEVGIVVKREPRYTALPIMLHLSTNLLNVGEADLVAGEGEWIEELTEGDYYGYARVLKKDGRLDFAFTDTYGAALECRPISKDDDFPVDPYAGICPYELILVNGVYDRKLDTDYFRPTAAEKIISYYPGDETGGAYRKEFTGEQVTIDFPPYDEQ